MLQSLDAGADSDVHGEVGELRSRLCPMVLRRLHTVIAAKGP